MTTEAEENDQARARVRTLTVPKPLPPPTLRRRPKRRRAEKRRRLLGPLDLLRGGGIRDSRRQHRRRPWLDFVGGFCFSCDDSPRGPDRMDSVIVSNVVARRVGGVCAEVGAGSLLHDGRDVSFFFFFDRKAVMCARGALEIQGTILQSDFENVMVLLL